MDLSITICNVSATGSSADIEGALQKLYKYIYIYIYKEEGQEGGNTVQMNHFLAGGGAWVGLVFC